MARAAVQITKLLRRDGAHCHYCNLGLNRRTATRDHVIPRAAGGPNDQSNYVVACEPCNTLRGTDLRWCDCDFCGPLIRRFKNSTAWVDWQLSGMVRFNHPRIRRIGETWRVHRHNTTKRFRTFEEAIAFATQT